MVDDRYHQSLRPACVGIALCTNATIILLSEGCGMAMALHEHCNLEEADTILQTYPDFEPYQGCPPTDQFAYNLKKYGLVK